jgi:hypothetical protein
MIDIFSGKMDSNKQSPAVGGPAIFFLREKPDRAVMDAFNARVIQATKPEVQARVVTIVQSAPGNEFGRYAVFSFIDNGIQWGENKISQCSAASGPDRECMYFDVYMQRKRVANKQV